MASVSIRWSLLVFCAIVLYLAFFYQLGNLAFIGGDEPRYARVAEEMNLGSNYLTPTLNSRPWLEKPPLLYWLVATSFQCFGVSEWAARFPVALLAALTTLLVGLLALHLAGWWAALFTVLILPTSGLFFLYGRAASMDMPLTAMLTAAMISGFCATRSKSVWWGLSGGIALASAVLVKGPVAIVLFGGVFLFYFWFRQKYLWRWQQTLLGLLVFFSLAVPWFWQVWLENGPNFVATFWVNHHLARFLTDIHHHRQPLWFYLVILIFGFFPWVFFLGSSLVRMWRSGLVWLQEESDPELFLWLWVAVPLLFFSLSESKLAGYILPVIPALAVIVGLEWNRYLESNQVAFRSMKIELIAAAAAGLVIIGALTFGFHFIYGALPVGGLLAFPLLGGMVGAQREFRRHQPLHLFLCLVVAITSFTALAYWKAAPIVDDYHSARDLSVAANALTSCEQPLILYRYFHHTAQYYTDYCTTKEAVPDLKTLRDYCLMHPQSRYYILTQEPGWKELESSFEPNLIRHLGNLYLVEITPQRNE